MDEAAIVRRAAGRHAARNVGAGALSVGGAAVIGTVLLVGGGIGGGLLGAYLSSKHKVGATITGTLLGSFLVPAVVGGVIGAVTGGVETETPQSKA